MRIISQAVVWNLTIGNPGFLPVLLDFSFRSPGCPKLVLVPKTYVHVGRQILTAASDIVQDLFMIARLIGIGIFLTFRLCRIQGNYPDT